MRNMLCLLRVIDRWSDNATVRPFGIATMSPFIDLVLFVSDLVSFVSEGWRRPPQMLPRSSDPQGKIITCLMGTST